MAAKNHSVGIAHRTVVPTNAKAVAEETPSDTDDTEDADADA